MSLSRAQRIARYQEWIDTTELAIATLMTDPRPITVRYGEKEVAYGPDNIKQMSEQVARWKKMAGCRSVIHITPV